jgi:hypothetical protein
MSRPFLSRTLPTLILFASLFSAASAPPVSESSSSLPDSPGAVFSSSEEFAVSLPAAFGGQAPSITGIPAALPRIKYITPGQPAPKQRAQDKILLGLRETLTPYSITGWVLSASWSHLIDGSPNYGVNGEAFAQRLGAAATLNSSKEIFSDSLLATAFHQDPRYYQLGDSHKFLNRGFYAATRPLVGRTDSGRSIPNYAFILGTGAAAALTQAYYPDRNISGSQFARTWVTSLGGSALGYLVSEFGGDAIQWLHISKHE